MIIIKTLKDPRDPAGGAPMLQDTVAGRIYTPRRPHLTEMNSFVESFVNTQNTGSQGGPSSRRPKALLVLVNSDECAGLGDNILELDRELSDAWVKHIAGIRKEAGGGKDGNKAVDALTDEQWATWCKEWVKQTANAAPRKPVKAQVEAEKNEEGDASKAQDGSRRNARN